MTSPKKDKHRIFENDPKENLKCLDCDVRFTSAIAKKYHETSQSKERGVVEHCDYCEFRSCTKAGLTRHSRQVHKKYQQQNYKLTCLDCDVKFKQIHLKKYHETSKAKKKGGIERCEYCEFRSCTKSGLARHTRQVHIEKFKLKCGDCGMKFLEDRHLNVHFHQCKAKNESKETDGNEGIDSFLDNYFQQNICNSVSDEVQKEDIKSKKLKCFQCDATFSRMENKDRHEAKVSENCRLHKCPLCPKKFCTELSQLHHSRNVHRDKYKFKCMNCNGKFRSAKSLYGHRHKNACKVVAVKSLKSPSPKSKQYLSCYKCDAKFSSNIQRKKHEEKSDSLFRKTFNCEYCREKFCTKASLDQHGRKMHNHKRKDSTECNEKENTEDEVFEIRKESNNPLAYKDTDTKLECNKCDATFSTLRCKKAT